MNDQASSPKPQAVLVAVDFGEASARAIGVAGSIAAHFGGRLIALHAERFDPPPYFTLEQVARLEVERRIAEAGAAAHLLQFALDQTAYPVSPAIVNETPVDAILHASANVDLVVVGTHGRRGPGRWWLGSVAERVVRGATVPVLVTRASTDPRTIFTRIGMVAEDGGAGSGARDIADLLAGAFGGQVIDLGPLARCRADRMAEASLIVIETSDGRPAVLGSCDRPVLFVPKLK